ncbi:hypothetical protein [Quadrisphaera sp. INWT6]|uniref:hypothetical protein n=1 Tax=Quadrisphaera sp. INWT6 TaxID=2596917 RepID=UPI001892577A|nr:hypothetical protein [Quadrisphaera sp. INWT6]MBF5081316.1 hypothetical protein [Quadrisphaera sp. INWT6]
MLLPLAPLADGDDGPAGAGPDAGAGDEHPAAGAAHGLPQRGAQGVVLTLQPAQRGAPVTGADRHEGAGRSVHELVADPVDGVRWP